MSKVRIERLNSEVDFETIKAGDYFLVDEILCLKLCDEHISFPNNSIYADGGGFEMFKPHDKVVPVKEVTISYKI